MLAVAILHWIAFGLMIWRDTTLARQSQDAEVISGILASVVQAVPAAFQFFSAAC